MIGGRKMGTAGPLVNKPTVTNKGLSGEAWRALGVCCKCVETRLTWKRRLVLVHINLAELNSNFRPSDALCDLHSFTALLKAFGLIVGIYKTCRDVAD